MEEKKEKKPAKYFTMTIGVNKDIFIDLFDEDGQRLEQCYQRIWCDGLKWTEFVLGSYEFGKTLLSEEFL